MIRLIASDMDGTLLEPGEKLPEGFFETLEQLKTLGIRFAAASGRQYDNLYRLFSPAARDMCFICENGAVNAAGREVISTVPIERGMALEIIKMLENHNLSVLVSGARCCYLAAGDSLIEDIVYRLRNTVAVVEHLDQVDDEIVKISAFCEGGIRDVAPKLKQKWGSRLNAAVSGNQWFDFTVANKGMGIRSLMQRFQLEREEVLVFGDNYNDESMFARAGFPFLMEKADPGLRKPGIRLCQKVLPVIQAVVAAKGQLLDDVGQRC